MDPQKGNMTVLARIVKQIPARIIDFLAKKFRIQTRTFWPTGHVGTMRVIESDSALCAFRFPRDFQSASHLARFCATKSSSFSSGYASCTRVISSA